jgi:hypothetical protein
LAYCQDQLCMRLLAVWQQYPDGAAQAPVWASPENGGVEVRA